MPKFKIEPVRYATGLLAVLLAVEAVNEAADLLPDAATPWLVGAIAVLSLLLGKVVRDRVTPLARPRLDEDTPLIPKAMAGPSSSGPGGRGMAGW
jgi:hypothetical protein